jgi:uncharacterized protein (TIGR00297 family)
LDANLFLCGYLTALFVAAASSPWVAGAVTLAFTLIAWWLRGVSRSGAVAGAVVCFVLYTCLGPGGFALLVSVFVLAWLTTRLGYARKQRMGTAERREGRTASQVLANLSVAALCGILYRVLANPAFIVAGVAALSEAAADTVSSEVGQASRGRTRLITSWQQVPAGTDGGISFAGTGAGLAAAASVALVGTITDLVPWDRLEVAVSAAVLGTIADSVLGAWLERRGWLNNDAVNFLGTLTAAAVALAITRLPA